PDIAVHIDAVEADLDLFAGGHGEPFPVPSRPPEDPASRILAFALVPVERADPRGHDTFAPERPLPGGRGIGREVFDAPIVGQVNRAPSGVVEIRLFRAGSVSTMEAPVVEQLIAPIVNASFGGCR